MENVLCPHCGKKVELTEAFTHQMKEAVRAEQTAKHKLELEKARTEAEERAMKRVKEELELRLKNSEIEAEEASKRNAALQEQLLELTKEMREVKQKDRERETEMQKQMLKERERMEIEITKYEQEKSRMEKLELQKKLEDVQKDLEETKRRAQQSSQQLQGEVLELDLENQLRDWFPTDDIIPVPKGFDGADMSQTVKNKFGQTAGIMLWETKRTKAWKGDWPMKLKDDKRRIDASCGIIVSDMLPNGIETFGFFEGVWVTCYKYALPLATVLRNGLLEVAIARSTAAHKDERLEALFNYLTKDGFRNKFEAQVESIIALKTDLDAEQRSTIRLWKKREMQLKRLLGNTATMYGELQGILGASLPSLPSLEGPAMLESSNEQESLLE